MPFINVKMLAGRSTEQKRALVEALTQAIVGYLRCAPGGDDGSARRMRARELGKGRGASSGPPAIR